MVRLPAGNSIAAPQISPQASRIFGLCLRLGLFLQFSLGLCWLLLAPPAVPAQSETYEQAEALVRSHRWDQGLAVLESLLKSDSRNLKALNLVGLALIGKGDVQQANEYFEKCIAIDPGFVPALKNLSVSEFSAQQYSKAEKHLLTAESAQPGDPVIHLYLGEIAYRQQHYQRAVDELSRAPESIAHNPSAAAHLAVSYLRVNDQPKALAVLDVLQPEAIDPKTQFQIAVALDQAGLPQRAVPWLQAVRLQFPDSYEVAFDLVLAHLEAKQFPEAIQTGKDLIDSGHNTAEVNNVLAQAYEGNAEIQQAFDAYRRAITLDPNDEENYLDLASLCIDQRAFQSGMKVVEVALMSHPRSERLVFMRGLLHAMQDDFNQAENDFKLSETLSPQQNLGYIGLGASYLQTGHHAEAIEVLRQRLHDKPNDASLLYLLGEALLRTGASPGSNTYAEAQTAFEKSVRLDNGLCLPHVSLGTIYLTENRPKDAVVQLEEARAIDPTERSAYSHLAVAYRNSGQPEKAKEVLAALKDMIAQGLQNTHEPMKAQDQQVGVPSTAEGHPAVSQE